MKNCKTHTNYLKCGKSVRLLSIIALFALVVYSCENLLDDPNSSDPRDKITGTWDCTENGDISGQQAFEANIEKSGSDSTIVYIYNFYGLGSNLKANAKMNGLSLTITSQTISGEQIQGTGTISSNYKTINWTFSSYNGAETDHVTSKYTKP